MKVYKIAATPLFSTPQDVDLWLDDVRDPTDPEVQKRYGAKGNEIWVKTVEEAESYISARMVRSISFDNDLGEDKKEGRHLAAWIEEKAYFQQIPPMSWSIHSENPIGRQDIVAAMTNAELYWEVNQ